MTGEKTNLAAGERAAAKILSEQRSFTTLAEALSRGAVNVEVGGVNASGGGLLLSLLSDSFPEKNLLVVTSGEEEAEDLYAALQTFKSEGIDTHFFPYEEIDSGREVEAATLSARYGALNSLLSRKGKKVVVASVQAFLRAVPEPRNLASGRVELRVGNAFDPDSFCKSLSEFGFQRLPQVELPGDFARRGGIVDVYPYGVTRPFRLEADGEVLSEIRVFDPVSQRSCGKVEFAAFSLCSWAGSQIARSPSQTCLSYLRDQDLFVTLEESRIRERAVQLLLHEGFSENEALNLVEDLFGRPGLRLRRYSAAGETASFLFAEKPPLGQDLDSGWVLLKGFIQKGGRVILYCSNEGDRDRLASLFAERAFPVASENLILLLGDLRESFTLSPSTFVISSHEFLHRRPLRRGGPLKGFSRSARGFFSLRPGDLAVHVAHGIGRYLGTKRIEREGQVREFLILEYRGGIKLYVPADKADLVSRYIGTGRYVPKLDNLTGKAWLRRCEAVERAVRDFASELIEIQARRQAHEGFAFPPDDDWQRQLEASFQFEETPDQREASEAVKRDMMAARCMDRLLCGDVGYGKTEIAVRAAFKAVSGGKQVAMLVPTTVLAEQHYQTFRDRLSAFPIRIEVLSRFQSKRKQAEILQDLRDKRVDIVIGTHRLLSDDVAFADLGLVIIDEEQRFGVAHKEKLKRLRAVVDVLTMTATPIPRTLHMALLGLRDISNLTTPPEGRSPIVTKVCRWDPELIRCAILRELDREGQVYFVHNRVKGLQRLKRKLEQIVPEAKIEIAHGQMPERILAETMCRFLRRQFDVLLCTTIIQSGLDIPTANTIFVSEADRYGLAELHQLRGRVGRYRYQAYAYFLLPEGRRPSSEGEKRLRIIERYSDLGSGFDIALKDLELRGAGNLLGPQQSGHIAQVGYDMYLRLLRKAVARLKKEKLAQPEEVSVQLSLDCHLPDWYVPQEERLELYRRISSCLTEEELDREEEYLRDRFGPLPEEARHYISLKRLRIRLGTLGITTAGREARRPAFKQRPGAPDLRRYSPIELTKLVQEVWALNKRVASDREAFEVFLWWSGEVIKHMGASQLRAAQ